MKVKEASASSCFRSALSGCLQQHNLVGVWKFLSHTRNLIILLASVIASCSLFAKPRELSLGFVWMTNGVLWL